MLLELENVSKQYPAADGDGVGVLRDVNLRLEAGQSLAVVGVSGSGKSTLLNLMGALDRPSGGKVAFDGKDLATLGDSALAAFRCRQIGFVFQMHHLLPACSVLENVLVPTMAAGAPAADAQERARELLDRVGLGGRLTHRPGQLSGGECQRVAVARALINRPRLVLADEPTGSLDRDHCEAIAELLSGLNRTDGVALVVVTHSTDLANRMQRVARLERGTMVEQAKA